MTDKTVASEATPTRTLLAPPPYTMASQPTASLPTTLRSPPSLDAYTPLAEHESRTPASFFEGPPVLHYHRAGARAYVSRENQSKLPWGEGAVAAAAGDPSWPVMGEDMVEQEVDIFVGSDTLTLYGPAAGCGVALPYPVIGLHAIKSVYTADNRRVPTLYMQLELAGSGSSDDADDEPETVELTLVPAGAAATTATEPDAPSSTAVSETSKLFDAISACADLHPDRFGGEDDEDDGNGGSGGSYPSFVRRNGAGGANGAEDGDASYDDWEEDEGGEYGEDGGILIEGGDDGAILEPIDGFRGVFRGAGSTAAASAAAATDLPPPMPGSGGWITAENAHEFFDEEGNWRGRGGSLGGGAGRVRGRDEAEAAEAGDAAAGAGPAAGGGAAAASGSGGPGTGSQGTDTNGQDGASNGDGTESKRMRTE